MMMRIVRLIAIFPLLFGLAGAGSALAQDDHEGHEAGGELELGRYVGHLKLDDTGEKFALTVDTYLDQPEDRTQFPRLNAIFRLQLGGYDTAEYLTELFEDIRYDFNNGLLSLDEPGNDLVITAEVHVMGRTMVVGQAWIRSAATSGTIYLEYQSDEPGDEPSGDEPGDDEPGDDEPGDDAPFMAMLAGQYEGRCGNWQAAMQVSTGRGLGQGDVETRGMHGYGISARLAEADSSICGERWCVQRNFSAGRYNPFSGKLILDEAGGTTECRVRQGRMTCRLRVLDETINCDLNRVAAATLPYRSFPRRFHVRTTAEQRQELPPPASPAHTQLVAALRGNFAGWLHNETTDRYQPFRLNVMPTVSSENPHNENEVVITASAVQSFGRTTDGDFWSQQFDRRSFYLTPGFNLESANTDGFLQIEEWRTGSIRGVWYSHAFGRVGTVQLLKGATLPPLDGTAKVVSPIAGAYQGPSLGTEDVRWWFEAIVPTQPVGRQQSFLTFEGMMQLTGGLGVRVNIAQGSYDVYTGAVAWLTEERDRPRMIHGYVDDDGRLMLLWTGAPIWGVALPEYEFVHYERAN